MNIDSNPTTTLARIIMIGSGGRLGQVLRIYWADRVDLALRWTTHRGSHDVLDPLMMPVATLAAAMADCDIILNLAGPVPRAGRADDAGMAAHPALATALLNAAQAAGVAHVVLLSSAAVYGDSPGLLTETTPVAPRSAYGHAKLAMERIAADWKGPPRATVLRLGNVAGADMLLGGYVNRDGPVRLHVFPDGTTPLRSTIGPTTLSRVLADILLPLHRGTLLPGLLNLAAPGAVAMGDLLSAAGLPWESVPAPPGSIERVTLATKVLESIVTFDPAESTAAGIVNEWQDFRRRTEGDP